VYTALHSVSAFVKRLVLSFSHILQAGGIRILLSSDFYSVEALMSSEM
jgi:hypothetical protein